MIERVLAVLLLALGVAVFASGVGLIASERLWLRFERMQFGSTIELPVPGVRASRGAGRNLMRATFRRHLRAAQVLLSIAARRRVDRAGDRLAGGGLVIRHQTCDLHRDPETTGGSP